MQITFGNLTHIPLKSLDRKDSLTDFSLGPAPDFLKASIREIGVIHPIILTKSEDRLRIICGHRRVAVSESMDLKKIPALIASSELNEETMLMLNLNENRAHRTYSDIEKGLILLKLADTGTLEDTIIRKYMPLLGIERSKKLHRDLSAVNGLNLALQELLHELNVPVRIFFPLIKWDAPSRDAAEKFFGVLRPGINKWRELLELVGETAEIENKPPAELLHRKEIQSILVSHDLQAHEKYDRIVQTITPWRTPVLAELKKKIAQTLDKMDLGPQTKIRIQESLETEEIKIEIKGRDPKSLADEVKRLNHTAQSDAMKELMRILKELN